MKPCLAALFLCASAIAADFNQPGTFLDPASAGPDYADQGEYLNDWGGAQVIALGQDKFRLVIYKGGLPGAGWDGERNSGLEGKREGDQIVFAPSENGFKHFLAKGVLRTVTGDGTEYRMNKTERKSPASGAKPPRGALRGAGPRQLRVERRKQRMRRALWPGETICEHVLSAAYVADL
jgi:hypothetical protein